MRHESTNWIVQRRLGIGDRQHVRNGLLSFGCFSSNNLLYAAEACFMAGAELKMMPRVHLNYWREHVVIREQLTKLTLRFMAHDAQMMEHGWMKPEAFIEVFESCDFIITSKDDPKVCVDSYTNELVMLIKDSWRHHGERFLRGNFARESADELRLRLPQYHPSSADAAGHFYE